MSFITEIAHINLTVPRGTLETAAEFYGETLALTRVPVPSAQTKELAWFNIGSSGQQVHIAFPASETELEDKTTRRHACFKLASPNALQELQARIYAHHEKGGDSAPSQADKPGDVNSGAQGKEYPTRFFARDYAGNRLEFSL
ncbi:hypothetical protein NliqN6_2875 [Naganishia liquefaciens]|uniref:Glyoxalase family protein n=1 Tax=Naganishia liquefaciens TaxID=104408 RepID=A0A8H3TST8_9TREE|nr:hypothetical protein NliqN6_2875 [Naganishia liquefaciens]